MPRLTPTPAPRVVELFAGVGGFRIGLERSGWQVVWANQWEPTTKTQPAFDCYVARFETGEHVCADIHEVMNEAEAGRREIPDHELLVGGFPCFAAGTMVLTASGHKPIEQVNEGDLVLTHLGRWRRVTATMARAASETITLRGQGFPDITTTPEHPFWARQARPRMGQRVAARRARVRAPLVDSGCRDHAGHVPEPGPPAGAPHAPVDIDQSEDFYWVVGRYLADGWRATPGGKGRVVIWASKDEAAEVEARIRRVLPCTPSAERTVVKFHITRSFFYRWLEDFGQGADWQAHPGLALRHRCQSRHGPARRVRHG